MAKKTPLEEARDRAKELPENANATIRLDGEELKVQGPPPDPISQERWERALARRPIDPNDGAEKPEMRRVIEDRRHPLFAAQFNDEVETIHGDRPIPNSSPKPEVQGW